MLQLTPHGDINMYITIFIGLMMTLVCTFIDHIKFTSSLWWYVIVLFMMPLVIFTSSKDAGGIVALMTIIYLASYRKRYLNASMK